MPEELEALQKILSSEGYKTFRKGKLQLFLKEDKLVSIEKFEKDWVDVQSFYDSHVIDKINKFSNEDRSNRILDILFGAAVRIPVKPERGIEGYEDYLQGALEKLLNAIRDKNLRADNHTVLEIAASKIDELADSYADNHQTDTDLVLPSSVDTKYLPRKSGKASEFLVTHYGEYIDAGICFRPDVKRLDPKLEMALANEFRGRPEELRSILPNQTDAADARLAKEFGRPIRPAERKAAMIASSANKHLRP